MELSEFTNGRGEVIRKGDRIRGLGSDVVRTAEAIYPARRGRPLEVRAVRVVPGPRMSVYLASDEVRAAR